jgi:hypothetical protein
MKNKHETHEDIVKIFVNGHPTKKYTIISLSDLELADSFKGTWTANKHAGDKWYIVGDRGKKSPKIRLHRLIRGEPEDKVVDHWDGDTFNNTNANLKSATIHENNQNTKGHEDRKNKLPKNVYRDRRVGGDKYKVTIFSEGKQRYFGTYDSIEEAESVANEKRLELQPYTNVQQE